MRKFLFLPLIIFLIFFSDFAKSQTPTNQDCLNAIPVCESTYYNPNSYSGDGNYHAEIGPYSGTASDNGCPTNCLSTSEVNDVWYTFQPQTSGNLNFTITPVDPNDDYDWALYNLTTDNCSSLTSLDSKPWLNVSCNFCGTVGNTGANGGGSTNCEGPNGCTPFNALIPVVAGQIYYLNVSNFSATQSGYLLDFTSSTAALYDNNPPHLLGITGPACGGTSINVIFNENVLCSTVHAADFIVTGPNSTTYTVTSVSSAACTVGAQSDDNFTITITPALTLAGFYTVCLSSSATDITDACFNAADPNDPQNCISFPITGPTATAGNGGPYCAGQTISLNSSGGGTYSWTGPDNFASSAQNPTIPNSTTANDGIYTVTVNVNGCTSVATTTVTVNAGNAPVITPVNPTVCSGTPVVLHESGATSYTWIPMTGITITTGDSVIAAPTQTTTYTVTGTTGGNCPGTTTVTVNVNQNPVITIDPASPAICQGQSVNLVASGASTYVWHHGNSLSDSTVADPTATPLTTTTYTVNGTSAQNCSGIGNVTVTVYNAPQANVSGGGTICNNGTSTATVTITLTGTAPWTVVYTNGTTPTTVTINSSPYTFSTSVGGTYTVTSVIDAHNCNGFGVGSATVTVVNLPVVTLPPFTNTCISTPAFPLTGGTPPGGNYTGTGVTNNNFNPATAGIGTHTITYTFTDGTTTCTASATNTITVEDLPTVTLQPFANVCDNAGPFNLSGGSPVGGAYSGPGVSSNIFNPSVAGVGTHTITYTYTNPITQCSNSTTGQITVNGLPSVTFSQLTSPCLNDPAITLTEGNPVGGVYSGPGVTNGIFNPVDAGAGIHMLTYTYTDPLTNCSNTATQNITVKPLPNVTLAPFGDVCLSTPTYGLTGGLPLGGVYSGPSVVNGYFDPSAAGAGVHTITYTYTDPITNCTNSASGQLVVKSGIPITVTPSSATVCKGFPVTLHASGADTYHWTPPSWLNQNNDSVVVSSPEMTTTYTVNGSISTNACSGFTTVTVSVYPPIGLQFDAQPSVGCRPLFVNYQILPNPEIDTNSIVWNFGDVLSDTNFAYATFKTHHWYYMEGNYYTTLTVNSLNGCPETVNRLINVYVKPEAAFSHVPEIGGIENPTVSFFDNTIGATSWYWNFDDPNTLNDNFSELQNPIHTFSDSGSYNVVLIAAAHNGCEDTAMHVVLIQPGLMIFIPNAFSPNGDKLNETFKPITLGIDPKNFTMHIYDRWGKKVFETSDLEAGWDGKGGDGKLVSVGVYVYRIWYQDMNGKEYKRNGIVTVLR